MGPRWPGSTCSSFAFLMRSKLRVGAEVAGRAAMNLSGRRTKPPAPDQILPGIVASERRMLTAVYQPADVYAGELVIALGMIDHGTTTAVDTSQVQHTPEHTYACIRPLQESGL